MAPEPIVLERAPARSGPDAPAGSCLVCGHGGLEVFLDLGRTALANRFLTPDELHTPEPRHPLRLAFCEACAHVQLMDRVPPADMFADYLYVSSASETLKRHFSELSATLVERHQLDEDDLVVDIGCNDGTLLEHFRNHGVATLGVDPAVNLAALAADTGIDRFTGFFGATSAAEIVGMWGKATLITATNTFPHIQDLADFITGLDRLLAPGGAFVLEAHYLMDLLDQVAFDTVYHEHVSYWALGPMVRLFERHGFRVVRAERLPLHHGQLRVTAQRSGEGTADESVQRILRMEHERGLDSVETYRAFGERVHHLRDLLRRHLSTLNGAGCTVVGYGAPAKGSTLLEFVGAGPETLRYIVDRSPLKQGRYTPGSHIPIVPVERLLEDMPDYVLLLAWNFVDEVLAQQSSYRERGGRFLLPVPDVTLV